MADLVRAGGFDIGSHTRTHGHSADGKTTTEYNTWAAMLQRCRNPQHRDYPHYGGRGIIVCEEWKSFENFLADVGTKPSPQHTLERKENDLGYSKGNCCWATRIEQARNQRSNILVRVNGEWMCLAQAAETLGVSYPGLWRRYRGKGISLQTAVEDLLWQT